METEVNPMDGEDEVWDHGFRRGRRYR